MKVVLDSNVIIAAFASRGLCADILEYCLYEECLVSCDAILHEVQQNLCKKLKLSTHKSYEVMHFLSAQAKKIKPAGIPHNACRDKNDLMVLGTAEAAQASCIVTGDKDLLILKTYAFIPILTPREFWLFAQKKK
jgi:uncharacterized protein